MIFKDFNFKVSYFPRQLGNPGNIQGQKHTIMDDYEGQTIWLSIKVGRLFSNYIPKYFNFSIGYSVRNIHDQDKQHGVFFIAPDIDFSDIIPKSSDFLKNLAEGFNYFKFPTPAIQISPRLIMFALYY